MRHGAPRLDRVRGWAFRTQTSYRRNVRPRVESVGWTCLLYPPCSMPSLFRTNPMRFDWLRTLKPSRILFEDENSGVVSRLQWKADLGANPI